MLEVLSVPLVYCLAGLTLKIGDDFLDEANRSDFAWFPLGISGFFFGFLMSTSEWDMVLMVSIILGVLASGKVNRPQFGIGFVVMALTLVLLGVPPVTELCQWLTSLVILFLASVLDELGNNWANGRNQSVLSLFFNYRFTLKVSAILLSLVWPDFLLSAVGLWAFDLGYELAGRSMKHFYS